MDEQSEKDSTQSTINEPQRSRTKRVVYFHPSSEMYGADRMALETVVALNQEYRVTVVLPDYGPLADELENNGLDVKLFELPVLRKSLFTPISILNLAIKTPGYLHLIRKIIKNERADLVYINTIIQPWVLMASFLSRIPSAVHVREAENSLPKLIQVILNMPLTVSSAVVCNSRQTRNHVLQNNPFVKKRISVIYNGKEWKQYFKSEPRDRRVDDRLSMVLVGRLSPRKGTDLALEALIRLRKQGIDARLDFAGSVFAGYEWYEEQLRDRADQADVGEFCRFLGFQTDTAIIMETADVVLVPSREEPFGTVAAEAQAAKRPVIVASEGGLPEIVSHGETGLVFDTGDIDDLVEQCLRIARNPHFAFKLANKGFDSVNSTFSRVKYRQNISKMVLNLF